jgi:hypothetical protein
MRAAMPSRSRQSVRSPSVLCALQGAAGEAPLPACARRRRQRLPSSSKIRRSPRYRNDAPIASGQLRKTRQARSWDYREVSSTRWTPTGFMRVGCVKSIPLEIGWFKTRRSFRTPQGPGCGLDTSLTGGTEASRFTAHQRPRGRPRITSRSAQIAVGRQAPMALDEPLKIPGLRRLQPPHPAG